MMVLVHVSLLDNRACHAAQAFESNVLRQPLTFVLSDVYALAAGLLCRGHPTPKDWGDVGAAAMYAHLSGEAVPWASTARLGSDILPRAQ